MVFYYIKIFLYAVIGLGVLVFIHELGHFIGARLVKIPVEKFSIGWGKALFKKQIGNTTFQVGWFLIIGGFCKMKGQDDFAKEDPDHSPDSFYGRPAWARLVAVFGGPFFSYLFAILLFALVYFIYGKYDLNYTRIAVNPRDAGVYQLQTGDEIVSVNNRPIKSWTNLKEALIDNSDTSVRIQVRRYENVINGIPLNSYDNFFKIMSQQNASTMQIEQRSEIHTIHHNQTMARLAKPFKDIMVFTADNPQVHSVSAENNTPAYGKLFKGDILIAVNKMPVFQFEELVHYINEFKKNNPDGVPVFQIYRKGKNQFSAPEIAKAAGERFENVNRFFIQNPDKSYAFKPGLKEEEIPGGLKVLFRSSQTGFIEVPINPIQRENRYIIGIQILPSVPHLQQHRVHVSIGFFSSWALGFTHTNNAIWLNIKGIVRIIRGDIPVKGSVGGPIKIFTMLGQMGAEHGIITFINFVALISALLAFANMLPIPAVDGSHIILSIIEMIRRKDFSPTFIRRFQTIGLITLVGLLLVVTYLDIFSFFN